MCCTSLPCCSGHCGTGWQEFRSPSLERIHPSEKAVRVKTHSRPQQRARLHPELLPKPRCTVATQENNEWRESTSKAPFLTSGKPDYPI